MNLMYYICIMRDVNIMMSIIIARSKSADRLNHHLDGGYNTKQKNKHLNFRHLQIQTSLANVNAIYAWSFAYVFLLCSIVCKFLKFISCQNFGIDHWASDTVYHLSLTNHNKYKIYHYTFKASDAHIYVKNVFSCAQPNI